MEFLKKKQVSPWKKVLQILFLITILVFSQRSAQSQDKARTNWYFGNSPSGIQFNQGNRSATLITDQAVPFGMGGSVTATDPATGNLLFYTNGDVVYDGCHALMPGGRLTANTSGNQPVAISPIPGQLGKYYLFSTTADYTRGGVISQSVVDMNLLGNALAGNAVQGALESVNTALATMTNRSEGMIVVPHDNGVDFWLITHEVNSNNYDATLIDATTYPRGIFTSVSSLGIGNTMIVANMTYHSQRSKIAVSSQSTDKNSLILDFDTATGTITFDRVLVNTLSVGSSRQSIYDMAWSLSGQYLYISRHGEADNNAGVLRYDYDNPSTTLMPMLPTSIARSYGIQLASDTAIYHVYQNVTGGDFLLGKLTDVEQNASNVVYTPDVFGVSFSGTQFPSFIPKSTIAITATLSFIGSCQKAPTTFFATVTPNADSLIWDFGDGNQGRGYSPIHTYEQAQAYNVSLTVYYQGQKQTIIEPVTINAFPLTIDLVSDTTACRDEFPPPRGSSKPKPFQVSAKIQGGNPVSTIWSNGDVGNTLTPDSAGYYYVVASDASGCSAYAGVNVKEYKLEEQRANIWYFGNQAGIDFNPLPTNPPKVLSNSAMNAPAGTSTISDRNGQVIFYTDGDKVYNKKHLEIATGIGGDPSSSQAALIVPVPEDETLYYIFTTQSTGAGSSNELRYSLFDIKQNNGLGAVVEQNVLLYAKSSERIVSNGSWLISHEYGNNVFRTYPITKDGIGDPVLSNIGSSHACGGAVIGQGYMKLSNNNDLAVSLSRSGLGNAIEIFRFDDTSGIITDYRNVDMNELNGQVYGIEFSQDAKKLFATIKGIPSSSSVHEYNIDDKGVVSLNTRTPYTAGELGALQTGPDGQIYMAINGSNTIGTIQAVNDPSKASVINFSGLTLATSTVSGLGLPSFVQIIASALSPPGISFTGQCLGQLTNFTGTPTDPIIDKYQWFFGDGGSNTIANPEHTYATAGDYTVSLRLTNRCGLDTTMVKPITIHPATPAPTLPATVVLCDNTISLDANSNNLPGYTYRWSSGETTQTLTVSQATIVSVTNTDTNGCTSQAETFVSDNTPKVDLGSDVTVCETDVLSILDALNPGATYVWTLNGTNVGSGQTQQVDLSVAGVFVYEVVITDPITNCAVTKSKTYTVHEIPVFTIGGTDPSNCGVADGIISLTLDPTNPAGRLYSYTFTGPGGFNEQDTDQRPSAAIGPFAGQRGGVFMATVTDQSSGCRTNESYGLSEPALFGADFTTNDCDPTTVTVTITSGKPTAPVLYSYTNSSSGQTIAPTANNTAQLSPGAGDYVVTVQDDNGNGCLITITKVVVITPKNIDITDNLCANPATITANLAGATGYTWIGTGITSGQNTNTIFIDASGIYEVTATLAGGCEVKASKNVITDPIVPTFNQSDACAKTVILKATPTHPTYTYRWYKGGIFQSGLLGERISLGVVENGSNYAVEVVNTINGCTIRSANKPVSIVDKLVVNLTSTQACNDGSPFTLTATPNITSGISYAWIFNESPVIAQTSPTFIGVEEGTYKVTVSTIFCSASDDLQVIKAPVPRGDLPQEAFICDDPLNPDPKTSQVILDPGEAHTYLWLHEGLSTGVTSREFVVTERGLYQVDITNSFGCSVSHETLVKHECIPELDAPTAFRPDSDIDSNKTFSIYSLFVDESRFEVFIYNRWGELIFQSDQLFFKWNGRYNNVGKSLPDGQYTYVVKYIGSSESQQKIQEKRGGVVLLR